ncbi:MAG: alpha/beta hydrolase [Acidimicrobiales bacterium]
MVASLTSSTLLLVHSPLVGPSTWKPLADLARRRGIDVSCPDLTGVADADSPQWQHLVDIAVSSATDDSDIVVVGHSGAGAVLPVIGEQIGNRPKALVFVDALVPPTGGEHRTPQPFLQFLDDRLLETKVVDGRLPKWLDWWPAETVNQLVESPSDLAELRADMPQLLRSFYDEPVPMPSNWMGQPSAYLKLSAAYDHEYGEVGDLGCPRASIDGTHLSIFTAPSDVLDAIEQLVSSV